MASGKAHDLIMQIQIFPYFKIIIHHHRSERADVIGKEG
jgi:hypothetical protein